MDFVVGLPESDGFDAIWVVVDRLTKQRHFAPCTTTIDATGLADLFLNNVFKLHGLPNSIISDRGTQFASDFWGHLCHCLGIAPRLSTAFHPETDGQTERINASMEEYLRGYVNYLQDDWAKLLPIAEFVGNNQISAATGASPFYATAGQDPRVDFELDLPVDNPEEVRAQEAANRLSDIHEFLRLRMQYTQAKYIDNADAHRLPAPAFEPGDMVFLDTRNIRTIRPSRKLDNKNAGPFRVIRKINPRSYELDLPAEMRLSTKVFHVSLLELARQDPLPGQHNPPPPPVIVDGQQEWLVDEIVDSRWHYGTLQYRVSWTGHDEHTWEPWYHVYDNEALTPFHERYPGKPGPMPDDAEPPADLNLDSFQLRRSSAPRGQLLSRLDSGTPWEQGWLME
jgi:transposase InsO family protein